MEVSYKVVTAFSGADALDTLQKKKRKVDLVLMSSKLPDMCAVEVLDILEFKYNMAVVMVFDTYQPNAMLEYLQNGAMFCVMKPLSSSDVAKLWHHSIVKETELLRKSTKYPKSGVIFKESEIHVADPSSFTWTPYLEEKFIRIICTLGVNDAAPIEILRHMNVPGLTINLVLTKLQECQERQILQFNSIRVFPTAYIIAQNAHNLLMGQNTYVNPGQAFANEQGYPVSGFLLNPHEDELNRARAYETPKPPTASLFSFAFGLNMFQLPQAPVPPANTAQRLIQPPWSSTRTDLPSLSMASSVPGNGEDDNERGK